jgi:tetratricopeptide (TPR) repeat protein/DNA-binding XRE family transcriptional regulator
MEHAASNSSFDQLLKTFRKRSRLTQKQLGELVGFHRQTIANYEGGRLPQNKQLVLDLAKALHLTDKETRELLDASLMAPTPHWVVPYPRNPYFTGREETLVQLHTMLAAKQKVALTSWALSGLGGIGKTQLALEYAYRYALDYTAVFWVNAETQESIVSSYVPIAESLALPERTAADQQQFQAAVQRWFNAHSGWLVIWDNLEDVGLISRFLATWQGTHLITTRQATLGTLAQGLELLPLPAEEALLFLLRRAKRLPTDGTSKQLATLAQQAPAEYEAAKALARLLDGLPLALDQAGAYMEETGCRIADYLERYQARSGLLLARRGSSEGHPESVMTTFALATERLARDPTTTDLLRLCAYLAPDAIPEELISGGAAYLGETLASVATDWHSLGEAFAALGRLSLVQRQPETRTLSLHRLVQAVLQESLEEEEQQRWAERTVRLVAAAFPDSNDFATWEQCQRLLACAHMCAQHIERWGFTFPEAAHLLNEAGHYQRQRAQLQEARQLLEQALAIREQTLGANHPDTAATVNNLAAVYWQAGYYQKALPLFQQSLAIREQTLGPSHPDVARSLSNVATLHRHLGQYQEAVPHFLRALTIFEQTLGPKHPHVGTALNNLADLYLAMGQYQEALPRYQEALAIREQGLGTKHPDVAITLSNMAAIYKVQQQYEQALSLHRRALMIREQAFEPDHPDIAVSLRGMAAVYEAQRQYEEALRLHQRALKICRTSLGPNHPEGVMSLIGMANIYAKLKEYRRAEALYQEALEKQIGPDHPDTALILLGLAAVRCQQGNLEEARDLYQEALTIQEQRLGSEHPQTNKTRSEYLQLMQMQPGLLPAQPQDSKKRRDNA